MNNFVPIDSELEFRLVAEDEIITKTQFVPDNFKPYMVPSIVRYQIMEQVYESITNSSGSNLDQIHRILDLMYDGVKNLYDSVIMSDSDKAQVYNYIQDWKSTEEHKGVQISSAFSRLDWFSK